MSINQHFVIGPAGELKQKRQFQNSISFDKLFLLLIDVNHISISFKARITSYQLNVH